MKFYFFTLLIVVLAISGCGAEPTTEADGEAMVDDVMEDSEEEITEDIDTSDLDELDDDFMKIEEFL
jgi:hypothetical protein